MTDKEYAIFEKVDGVGTVCLYEKESNIPHFDIVQDDGTKISIKIDSESYLDGSEKISDNKLSILNNWLKEPSKNLSGLGSNWSDIIFGWYGLYPDSKFEYDWNRGIPDYTRINSID